MRRLFLAVLLLLGACTTVADAEPSGDSLDAIAADYVRLTLEIGEREPGYVDAYYGPAGWAEAARAAPRDVPALMQGAAALADRLNAVSVRGADPVVVQRKAYLLAHVSAASARLRFIRGERLPFAEEAFALFGVRPELKPLSDYDAALDQIDAMLPGDGPLVERVAAFKSAFIIPRDRLEPVMTAAIAECRRRTAEHIALPANERFTLAFVTDKPWSGYNYFQGDAASRIEINTDFPIYTERAIDLGCHEGYPGHHVYNALLERTFVRERGWVEMSVYPLFSPMSFVAEGSANYGIDLAFPGDEGARFEQQVLAPLAGITGADFARKARLQALTRQLARAEYTIADDFLAGRVNREETIARLARYTLTTPDKAAQRLRFIETYRSYIINYGLGRDTVEAWVEAQGADHWRGMETLLASQILPVDLSN
ncbi:hypothetical protein HZ989_01905 [Brevundimonas sp. AJA228-03]|uniref:hypothetical protein n=1 Tax=Brevundimonas sp. AJA228-03 TaxID=2752515 RepID=UPI001ADFCD41|nr:hypothetical protein [Brevundimonas sp. AJA228-03]QTN19858.1 hypothetical protein HZ989_01905 [Brevundimonas sp. AJA228-03]